MTCSTGRCYYELGSGTGGSFVFTLVLCNPAVNQQFPVNWIWWVTLIIATILVSLAAEFAIYFLKDLKDIELDH